MDSPTVCILLATYNGEEYLRELLDSLAAQSWQHWLVFVRDDGSKDGTRALLAKAAASDARVRIIEDQLGNLGPVGNFGQLLACVESDYYMFADQDDVWRPDKIADSVALLREREAGSGHASPLLVFTDLEVTDANLRCLHASQLRRFGFERLIARGLPVRTLLTQNVAAGCTMLFNRALRDAAVPIPGCAVMHDWWLMLTAAATGSILFLDRATIRYRQHGANQVGAAGPLDRVQYFLRTGLKHYRSLLRMVRLQAGELYRRHGPAMAEPGRSACQALAQLERHPPPLRQLQALRHGLSKWGWLRNLVFYVLM